MTMDNARVALVEVRLIKDNFEGLFQAWLEQLGVDDWFKFADLYANSKK